MENEARVSNSGLREKQSGASGDWVLGKDIR
jgi:hypothetical protein